ncbi:claw keratin-like [Melanerpes formicivorus]|uniref:claw keratin-like n=1 Tax=Melanerpes formicivorus TaxID=211600 RepID=UPI00358EB770
MSCNVSSRCLPACEVSCPQPCAYSTSLGPSIGSCGDSTAVVYGPPVVIKFPGPILSTCPQETVVGASVPNISGRGLGSSSPTPWGASRMLGSSSAGGFSGSGGFSSSGGFSGSGGSSWRGGSCGSGIYPGLGSCYGSRLYSSSSSSSSSPGSRRGNYSSF